jgi:hypothetical protein
VGGALRLEEITRDYACDVSGGASRVDVEAAKAGLVTKVIAPARVRAGASFAVEVRIENTSTRPIDVVLDGEERTPRVTLADARGTPLKPVDDPSCEPVALMRAPVDPAVVRLEPGGTITGAVELTATKKRNVGRSFEPRTKAEARALEGHRSETCLVLDDGPLAKGMYAISAGLALEPAALRQTGSARATFVVE